MSEPQQIEPYLQPAAAAAFIGVSVKAITAWARTGRIPAYAIGEGEGERKMWRFKKSELDTWMRERQAKHKAAA